MGAGPIVFARSGCVRPTRSTLPPSPPSRLPYKHPTHCISRCEYETLEAVQISSGPLLYEPTPSDGMAPVELGSLSEVATDRDGSNISPRLQRRVSEEVVADASAGMINSVHISGLAGKWLVVWVSLTLQQLTPPPQPVHIF